MAKISITIAIDNNGKCQLNVYLTGPGSYSKNYLVTATNTTTDDLANGIYAIKVAGTSGNKVTLTVKGPTGTVLTTASQPGPKINIMTGFTVNTAPQLLAEDEEMEDEA